MQDYDHSLWNFCIDQILFFLLYDYNNLAYNLCIILAAEQYNLCFILAAEQYNLCFINNIRSPVSITNNNFREYEINFGSHLSLLYYINANITRRRECENLKERYLSNYNIEQGKLY